VVWAIESGEHMPDKKKYVEEMTRVLKPGGTLVFATWCQRDSKGNPLTPKEERDLDFLYVTAPPPLRLRPRAGATTT